MRRVLKQELMILDNIKVIGIKRRQVMHSIPGKLMCLVIRVFRFGAIRPSSSIRRCTSTLSCDRGLRLRYWEERSSLSPSDIDRLSQHDGCRKSEPFFVYCGISRHHPTKYIQIPNITCQGCFKVSPWSGFLSVADSWGDGSDLYTSRLRCRRLQIALDRFCRLGKGLVC